MTLTTVEAALETELELVLDADATPAVLGTAKVSFANWKILAAGPYQAIIIQSSGFANEIIAFGDESEISWRWTLHLCTRYLDDAQAAAKEAVFVQNVFTQLSTYPKLHNAANIKDSMVVGGATNPIGPGQGVSSPLIEVGSGHYKVYQINFVIAEYQAFTIAG